MSQPPAYNRQADFSEDTANNAGGRSTVNATKLDAELDAVETTLDALLTNLAILQRDDTKLRDGTVELHTLSAQVKALMAARGSVIRGDWVTGTVYAINDVVTESGATYICAVAHTSGVFATDLAASKWVMLMFAPSALAASGVSVTPAGTIAASDVQAALEELDTEKLSVASDLADLNDAPTALANLGALPLAGGTMTGKITLDGVPTSDLHAASKGYADDVINGLQVGQCRLGYVSATQIKLSPCNGNKLFINGNWYTIPAAGVTMSNSALSASSTYYIYAYNNSGSIALIRSSTAPAVDSTYGHKIANGTPSFTLVGMVSTNSSGQFVDSETSRRVLSFFNRRRKHLLNQFSTNRSTSATSFTQLNAEIALGFLTWGDEAVSLGLVMPARNTATTGITYVGLAIDSTTTAKMNSFHTPADENGWQTLSLGYEDTLSEGLHSATVLGQVGSGTGEYSTAGRLSGVVMG